MVSVGISSEEISIMDQNSEVVDLFSAFFFFFFF